MRLKLATDCSPANAAVAWFAASFTLRRKRKTPAPAMAVLTVANSFLTSCALFLRLRLNSLPPLSLSNPTISPTVAIFFLLYPRLPLYSATYYLRFQSISPPALFFFLGNLHPFETDLPSKPRAMQEPHDICFLLRHAILQLTSM